MVPNLLRLCAQVRGKFLPDAQPAHGVRTRSQRTEAQANLTTSHTANADPGYTQVSAAAKLLGQVCATFGLTVVEECESTATTRGPMGLTTPHSTGVGYMLWGKSPQRLFDCIYMYKFIYKQMLSVFSLGCRAQLQGCP